MYPRATIALNASKQLLLLHTNTRPVPVYTPVYSKNIMQVDTASRDMLLLNGVEGLVPFKACEDGSCLCLTMSFLCCGEEDEIDVELRASAVI